MNDGGMIRLSSDQIEIPDDIQSMIMSRIDILSEEVRSIIKTASVLGKKFSTVILSLMLKRRDMKEELSKREYTEVISPLGELTYIFRHAIIRDSLYGLQMKDRLRDLHVLAGECMEEIYRKTPEQHSGEMAFHFENGRIEEKAKKYLLMAGKHALKKFMMQNALDYYKRVLKYAKTPDDEVEFHEILGNVYEHLGRWDEALEEYFSWCGKAFENKLYKNYVGMNTKGAALLGQRGRFAEADEKMENAKRVLDLVSESLTIAGYYNINGTLAYLKGDLKNALENYQRFLEISEKNEMKVNAGRAKINIGMIQMMQGSMSEAEKNYLLGIETLKRANEILTLGQGYMQLGNLYFMTRKYAKAKRMYLKRLVISRKYGDRQGEAYSLGNLGNLVKSTGNFDEALDSFQKCYVISEEMGDMNSMILSLHAMANLYKERTMVDDALEMYDQALDMMKEYAFREHMMNTYKNKGEVLFAIGRHRDAIEPISEALKIAKKDGFKADEAKLLNSLSRIWFELKDFSLSEKLNAESCEEATKVEDDRVSFECEVMKNKLLYLRDADAGEKNILEMTKRCREDEDLAFLYLTLFKMTRRREYRKKSVAIYRKLYKKSKEFEQSLFIKYLEEA